MKKQRRMFDGFQEDGIPTRSKRRKVGFTSEEKKAINLRNKLMDHAQIAKETHLTVHQVEGVVRRYFKGEDPFRAYVIKCIKAGEGGKSIARKLKTSAPKISKMAKKEGLSLWDLHRQRVEKVRKKSRDNVQYARDLYCYILAGQTIQKLALENGYRAGTYINNLFLEHIPGYKEDSSRRRELSQVNKEERDRTRRSITYSTEKEFSRACVDLLAAGNGYKAAVNIRSKSHMEIDLMIEGPAKVLVVELKVTSRKVDEARAIGQVIINSHTIKSKGRSCVGVICFPDDVQLSAVLVAVCKQCGIRLARFSTLKGIVAHEFTKERLGP